MGTVQGAYKKKPPSAHEIKYKRDEMPYVTEDEVQFVVHLIESLQPADAIEAAIASQFVITYIRGLKQSQSDFDKDLKTTLQMFEFGHQTLETLQRYRTKGAQLINVHYNHNQGQINNIKVVELKNKQEPIEMKNEL